MEKFKINSQDLIKGAGGSEDIFNAINSPADNIFSLQRFANGKTYSIGQNSGDNAKTTLNGGASNKISEALTEFTLGRSSDSSTASASTAIGDWSAAASSIQIAPLVWSDTNQLVNLTYTLSGYKVSDTETRIAIVSTGLGAGSATHLMDSYGYWAGVALNTGTSVFTLGEGTDGSITSKTAKFAGSVIASGTSAYKASGNTTYYLDGVNSYTGLFFNLTTALGKSVDAAFFSGTSKVHTYSLDFYDVKLATATPAVKDAVTGSYTGVFDADKNLLFSTNATLNFNDISKDENETYSLNNVGITVSGDSNASSGSALISLGVSQFNKDGAQSFTGISVLNSSASIAFSMLGLGKEKGVFLNSKLYTSSNDSGTVTFSMTDTDKLITLAEGDFTLTNVGTETYILSDNASGTFGFNTVSTFTLDVSDGETTDDAAPVKFITGNAATVTGIADSSSISLAGTFTGISADDSMTGLQFALTDSTTANFTAFGSFSDTKDGAISYVEFNTVSDIVLTGVMSGTKATNAGTIAYTLKNTGTTFTLDGNTFFAKEAGTEAPNRFQAIATELTLGTTHASGTFKLDSLNVTGFDIGNNISMAGSFNLAQSSATLLNGTYFYSTADGATVAFASSGTAINGVNDAEKLLVSAVDSTKKLVGISDQTFTAKAGTFFLADGGTGTSINGLGFKETQDGHVSKLVVDSATASIGVFGAVELVGSDTGYAFTLNQYEFGSGAASNSKLVISGITFGAESGTVLDDTVKNSFGLGNSATSAFSISGDLDAVTSFTLAAQASAGGFQFGADTKTSIFFAASGTSGFEDASVIFGAGTLHASNTATVGGGLLSVHDAANSESYKVLLGSTGKVLGLSEIDAGAKILGVASATTVITNPFDTNGGTFTFSGTAVTNSVTGNTNGTSTQIFQITGADTDGVTYTLDKATGFVTAISGLGENATVNITDLTVANSDKYWTKSNLTGGVWTNTKLGTWASDKYTGYIVQGSGTAATFTVYGVESGTGSHITFKDTKAESRVGKAASLMFGLVDGVFASSSSVAFINLGGAAYSASDTEKGVLFTDFASNSSRMGLLFESGSSVIQIATVPTSGSATSISSIAAISDTVSLTLGDIALQVGDSDYIASGTGVGFAVNSEIATVSAGGATAYVGLGGAGIVFGSTGTGVYNIYSGTTLGEDGNFKHKLSVATTASGSASGTFKGDIFTMGLSGGASFTNTYLSGADMASSLSINDINSVTYGYGGENSSATFAFTAATSSASDTLTVIKGTIAIESDTFMPTTTFGLGAAAASTTLIVDAVSFTGISEATFGLSEVSDTMKVTGLASNKAIEEDVASGKKFIFNDSVFTAMGAVNFQIGGLANGTSETLLEGSSSATGVWNQEGEYVLKGLNSTTFVMQSGSSVIMTYAEGKDYNAAFTYGEGASGTFQTSTGALFNLSDYYLSGGVSDSKSLLTYTAASATTLSLTIGEGGSHTVKLTAGGGYRDVASQTSAGELYTFAFDPDGDGDLPSYTYTAASTLKYTIDSATALSEGANGLLFSGSAYRTLGANDSTSHIAGLSFNSDTYKPIAGATITLSVVNGVVSETFTAGSGTFVIAADADPTLFHFDYNKNGTIEEYEAYTSTGAVNLGVYFSSATDSGTLYHATGNGTRNTTANGQGTVWTFGEGIGESYTALASSTMALNINGTTAIDNVTFGLGTETMTIGTATRTVAVGDIFHISQDYVDGTGGSDAESYTYKVASGELLTLYMDNGSGTLALGAVTATRTETTVGATFSLNSGVIAGLSGTNLAESFVFSATGTAPLTYNITADIASASGAVGAFYSGVGTRLYGTVATDGTSTTMSKTFMGNTFMPYTGALMQVQVDAGLGTETFVSGSGTFTAAADTEFTFAITPDGTSSGTLQTYTAQNGNVVLGAYFADATATGLLYSAEGAATRLTTATETNIVIGDSFTMKEGSTLTVDGFGAAGGLGIGTETFTAGTGTFAVDSGKPFYLNEYYFSTTGKATADKDAEAFTYYASGTSGAVLTLNFVDGSESILVKSGMGTRDDNDASSFTFKDFAGTQFTYSTTGTAGLTYKIDSSSTSVNGDLYAGAGLREFGTASSTLLTPTVYNSDTYTLNTDAIVGINIEVGAGTETFAFGTATFVASTAEDTANIFHAMVSGTGVTTSENIETFSATQAGMTFALYNDGTNTSLAFASGTGLTTGGGEYALAILSDTYTMDANSQKTLTFDGVSPDGAYALVDNVEFTGGTGTLTLSAESSFSVANAFLFGNGVSDMTTVDAAGIKTYTATGDGELKLQITDSNKKILLGEVVGTRTEGSDTEFGFAPDDYVAPEDGPAELTYTAIDSGITYEISAEYLDEYSATGKLMAGLGTRTYGNEFTSTTMYRSFNSDTGYLPGEGAVMQVEVKEGFGTETFVSGIGTYTAAAGDGTFHFKLGNDTQSYTAKTDVVLGAYFADATATGVLASVNDGVGTRFTTADETNVVIGNSFTMLKDSTKQLDLSGVIIGEGGAATGSETWAAGTGTLSADTFYLNEYYYNTSGEKSGDKAATSVTFYASGTTPVELALNFVDGSETILIKSGVGTRELEGVSSFTVLDTTNKEFTYYLSDGVKSSIIYKIDSSSTSYAGDLYSGAGTRRYGVQGSSTLMEAVTFNSDTYTPADNATMYIESVEGKGVEKFVRGNATFTAQKGGAYTTFHATMASDTDVIGEVGQVYSATENAAVFTIYNDGSKTSLVAASGAGVTALTGEEDYAIGVLSNTYKMDVGTLKEISFNGTNSDSTYVLATGFEYTSGTGTLTLTEGSSFSVADAFLFDGVADVDNFDGKVLTYKSTGNGSLNLTIDGTNTKIALGEGVVGERSEDSGTAFTLTNVDGYTGDTPLSYTAINDGITYQISNDILGQGYSATGMLSAGYGTRDYKDGDFTATSMARAFNEDEGYMPVAGAVMQVEVKDGAGTETFVSGSGTFTATSGNPFHFAIGEGEAKVYTAAGNVILGASFSDTTPESGVLYMASGSGTRLTEAKGEGTFYTFDGAGDSFTMNAGATITLKDMDVVDGVGTGTEVVTAGQGTYIVEVDGMFSLADAYLSETGTSVTPTGSYTYKATAQGVLTVDVGTSTKLTLDDSLAGLRTSTDLAGATFALNNQVYSATGDAAAYFISAKSLSSGGAGGVFYNGTGTRTFADGTETTMYLQDTYAITEGTFAIEVNKGEGEEVFASGNATYTADEGKVFHFVYENATNTYTSLADGGAILSVSVDGTNTSLTNATGTGVRDIGETPAAYAVEALGGNVYSFTGTAQITIPTKDTASETAYSGDGTLTAASGMTVIAAFDSASNVVDTAYTYSMFADNTTFAITMESGTVKTQSITGSATRDKADDVSFVYADEGGNTYTYSTTSINDSTISSKGALTFELTKDSKDAQGTLLDGFGFRNLSESQTYVYTAIASVEYTLGTNAEFKLTVDSASDTAKEDLFNLTTPVTQDVSSSTFTYLGTQYTAQSGTVMQLTATNGVIKEQLSEGSALFQGSSSDTKFTYDENEYRVDGSATLRLEAGNPNPIFEKGRGVKEMSETDVFKYTDGNWYTAQGNALLTADGNEDAATVTFVSGTAVDNVTEGNTFNFTPNADSYTYTALTGGVTLGLSSTQVTGAAAEVGLVSGSATRLQDSGFTGQDFTFEGATYTSIADSATMMLTLQDNKAAEKVYSADASRTLTTGSFVYESPNSHQNETYTVTEEIGLDLHLVDGQGTETFTGGAGTRDIAQGDTFTLNPSNIYDVDSMTFTAGANGGTYKLTLKNDGISENSGLSFMGYNVDVVTEDLVDGTGTGTLAEGANFGFEMKVADGSNTYKAVSDIVFDVTVSGGANTATWLSGSGTMTLDSGKEFHYTPTDGTSNTYTVGDAATFLRTSEEDEYLTAGTGYRNLAAADSNFTSTYLENAYTADAGAMIVLSNTGVTAISTAENFGSGTATFNSTNNNNEFNFKLADGASHTYTGEATLQINVAYDGTQGLVGATGTGVRDLAAGETYSTTVIGNVFSASSGTYTIDFTNVTAFNAVTETFTGGTLVDNVADGAFYLNDEKFIGTSGTGTTYTYNAVGSATLTMTVTNGVEGLIVLDGAGTRTTDTGTVFSYKLGENENNYTATSNLVYKIDSASGTDMGAAGFLFTGTGTRLTTTEGGDHTFNSDTYTIGASATMRLTVTDAVGNEVMTQGTATYVATASSNDVFHFGSNEYNAYQSDTTLKISLEEDGSESLFYISGQGTRLAGEGDVGMTTEYRSDTYTAQAGSSTILFTATGANGELSSTETSIFTGAGSVVNNVTSDSNNVFHYNPNADENWYEYTAGKNVNISLSLSDSVQSFSVDPNAKRTASETSFTYSDKTYTVTSEGNVDTYSLTGSGTKLTDAIFKANGIRTDVSGDTATSNWANTYALTDGTYSIAIDNGTGTDVFSAGTGSKSYAAGTDVFNYGDSGTKFTANIDGATLTWNVDGTDQTETLTQGAAGRVADGSGTYIMAGTANVTLGSDYSTNVTLSAVDSNTAVDGVVTLQAITFDKDAFTGGVSAITGSAGGLNVALGANGSIGIKGKLFEATDTASMTADSGLSVFNATSSATISAEGDFTSGGTTLAKDTLGIADDTDVAAFFNKAGVQRLEKLTGGVTVSDAAGAVRAVTDSTGTFIFNSTETGDYAPASGTQKFTISGADDSVIFQLNDNGLVTGISGLDASSDKAITITIKDAVDEDPIVVEKAGMALTRDAEGRWNQSEVVATAYLVTLGGGTDDTVEIYAIDSMSDLTKVDADRIGSLTDLTLTINETIISGDNAVPVYVVNKSTDKVIDTNYLEGIGYTSDTAAVKLTATEDQFEVGTINGVAFTGNTTYSVADGKFSVDASGAMDVAGNVYSTAGVTMGANNTVELVATVTGAVGYAINGGTPVTVETYDSDGYGEFGVMLNGTVLSGLDPNGVDTGAVLVDTTADGTTFAITNTKVTVTGDTDGMTLAIENDTLVGLDDIATDATINVSNDALKAGDTLTIGTDTVTLKADGDSIAPIKYNTTNDEWTSGLANSVAGATGYLVTVNASDEVELYFTNATQTVPTVQTTNVNDYKAVFGDSGIAPSVDGGALPAYNGVTINGGLADTVNVSVMAGSNGFAAVVDGDDNAKDLILVTSNGNYTINGQQIIPTAQITVNAVSNNTANVTLSSAVTISHDGMQFNATSDTAASFVDTDVYLNDTSKVTNTTNDANFYVSGAVTFDNIMVKANKEGSVAVQDVAAVSSLASAEGSGLTVGEKGFTLNGGDLNYTVDVTGDTPTISGIDGGSTLDGELSAEAKIMTASTGVFKINASEPFTISNDSDVTFTTANNSVTAIDSLEGVVTGNFSNSVVNIDGDHSVLVLNDDQIGVTANGTKVTEIDGVGSASTDVVVANAGGASLVTTDLNGSIYFGTPDSTNSAHHYTVADEDSQVSFLTSTLADYVPSVTGVLGLNEGTIAISQDETGFSVNDGKVSLGGVSSDVTIAVANDTISSVLGLEGSVNGLSAGVVATAIDSDVTVNGATLQVVEPNGTTLNVYAADSGFDTVTGLNKDASVSMARNAYVVTEEVGAFTFGESDVPQDTYTISGDSSVTFETDGKSQVKNIADFAGTLQSTAYQNTVNGAVVAVDTDAAVTDVSIASAGTGVSSVLGLGDGDSVTVPNGTSVQMPGTSSSDTDTALTINGKTYELEGDEDGVAIKAGSDVDTVAGLAAGARLTVGASGIYNVNNEILSANIGDVIIGDEEGAAHVYSDDDVNFDTDTSTDEIVDKITGAGSGSTDRYVESLEAAEANDLVDSTDPAVLSSLNGNLQMTISGGTDTTESGATRPQTADFSNNTGIKKVDMQGDGDQNVKFNDEGGNIAIVSSGVGGAKNVSLGNGGDLAVVEDTGLTPVNITTGRGKDTVVTKGRNVKMNMTAGGPARVMPTAGTVEMEGYDASTGAGIQLTNSNVALAVKTNAIKLQNGSTTVNGGAAVVTNPNAETVGQSIVNFYNLKGLMTKVGYTHDDGGMVDLRSSSGDVVMKGNYTENSAQRKGGGSTLVSGSGNDTAFGGAGDAFDLGSGDNTITMDTDRSLSESGAIVSQSAEQGRTEVNNFHTGYSDTDDRIRIDVSKATVKFVGSALRFVLGAATLLLNAVASNADLAESADETDSKIGSVNSEKVMIEDSSNSSNTAYRVEVASAGNVINVERVDDVITQSYMGENSGVNLATFDESAFVNLNQGEGMFGGEYVRFGGITKLQGGSTVNTLIGSGGANNTIVAGVGGGSIWGGGASNDTMSGVGSTLAENKATSNSFFFMNGDGKDLITDFDFLTADNADRADRININDAAVTEVITSGNDVIISLTNEADKLTIKDAVGKDFNFDYGQNSLTAQVNANSLDFDGRANYYQATGKNAAISANSELSSADIWLNNDANYSSNLFLGDIKYLNASGIEGKATLVGNSNDNVITASTDNTSMWGGDQGGNDVMIGGAGADIFWYGKNNNGNDTITQIDGNDTINLYDISLDDISTADVGSGEIAITLKETGNVLRVQGNVTAGEGFRLKDGTTYTVDSNRNWVQK